MSENDVLNLCNLYSINIVSKNGESLDLSNVFMKIEIYEDIFSHYLTAMLSIKDTSDMLKNFPVIGGEYVEIAFADSAYNSARFFDFYVEEVMPQTQSSNELNKNVSLIFKLASADHINALNKRFSYKFEDTSYSILNTIFSSINSKRIVQSIESEQMEFVANFWNVDEIIDYISYQNKDSLFFETSDQYRFETLNNLVSQSPVHELFMMTNVESKVGLNTVQQYQFDKYFSILKMLNIGGFGKTVYKPSIENYGYEMEKKTLNDVYDNDFKMMGSNKPFQAFLSSFDNDIDVDYDDLESSLTRNIILSTAQNYNLTLQINGSLKRKAGDVVKFNLPSFDNQPINQNFQNDWLILQIKHIIEANRSYKQNIRLFKNAFFNNAKVG